MFKNAYTYDPLDRLTRIDQTDQNGAGDYNRVAEKRVDFTYRADGAFDAITRYKAVAGGGTNDVAKSSYIYDDLGRLTSLQHVDGQTSPANIDHFVWEYDAASRLKKLTQTYQAGSAVVTDYDYDHTNQLTSSDTADSALDRAYEYDENGNRTGGGYGAGPAAGAYNRIATDGTYDYQYDAEGNMTVRTNIVTGERTEFAWDHRNRLTSIATELYDETLTKQVAYNYDPFDRRIRKRIDNDGDGEYDGETDETSQYVYDGDDIILALDAAGSLTNRYLHGPAVDQILADEQYHAGDEDHDDPTTEAGIVYWPLTDNLGSVRDLVDSTGAVANHITYDAFGNVTSEKNGAGSAHAHGDAGYVDHIFAYTGRERDYESHLQYNRARYYDPAIGRWLSEDPLGFAAGDENLHRYVGNGPTNGTDPDGLKVKGIYVRMPDYIPYYGYNTIDMAKMWRRINARDYKVLQGSAAAADAAIRLVARRWELAMAVGDVTDARRALERKSAVLCGYIHEFRPPGVLANPYVREWLRLNRLQAELERQKDQFFARLQADYSNVAIGVHNDYWGQVQIFFGVGLVGQTARTLPLDFVATTLGAAGDIIERPGLDALQSWLDIAGLIPVLGEIADGTNAIVSFARNRPGDGALSMAAMIPVFGTGATGAKFARKGVGELTQAEIKHAASGALGNVGANAANAAVPVGTKLTRNWGGNSGPFGNSWTRDPVSIQTRESLGLGYSNTGEFVSHGELINNTGVTTRSAQPWGGFGGGGNEVLVPTPQTQIQLRGVTMPDIPLPPR